MRGKQTRVVVALQLLQLLLGGWDMDPNRYKKQRKEDKYSVGARRAEL